MARGADVTGPGTTPEDDWQQRPLPELVDHILEVFHSAVEPGFRHLRALIKQASVQHPSHRLTLDALSAALRSLEEALTHHMAREETQLFPLVKAGHRLQAGAALDALTRDHAQQVRLLAELQGACAGLPRGPGRRLILVWEGVDNLAAALLEHADLEDHILFPRAQTEGT